jgi:multidrug efflux pump subunit AcrA (membrane-fusion protein)
MRNKLWAMGRMIVMTLMVIMAGCQTEEPPASGGHVDGDHKGGGGAIDVPPSVRQNLGITFVKVAPRQVQESLRLPGRFELLATARREYRGIFAGRVTLQVGSLDRVVQGQVIAVLESPDWLRMQHELSKALVAIEVAKTDLTIAQAVIDENEATTSRLSQRIEELKKADVRKIELETSLAESRTGLKRLKAEQLAKEIALRAAIRHYQVALNTASAAVGLPVSNLSESVPSPGGDASVPRWSTIKSISIVAKSAGVVEKISATQGGWVEAGETILSTVDPTKIRFHAHGLQSDLMQMRKASAAFIVPPQGSGIAIDAAIAGKLQLGFRGHPDERTFPVYVTPAESVGWARPGISAFVELVTGGEAKPQLAIPRSSIIRDGLHDVFFRRDPKNPNRVIRIKADLGTDDGRWVVVRSGVKAGDEVVLEGVYELKLASSQGGQKGGHFHADGTFHEEGK